MQNFICLRHCVQDKMQVSQKFTDKPRKNRSPITIRQKNDQLKGNFPLLLTKAQINRIKQIKQELI